MDDRDQIYGFYKTLVLRFLSRCERSLISLSAQHLYVRLQFGAGAELQEGGRHFWCKGVGIQLTRE